MGGAGVDARTRARRRAGAPTEFLEGAASKEIIIKSFRDGYLPFQGVEVKDFFEVDQGQH